jgi:hypothetical protein
MATGEESYFYTVPEGSMPVLPDLDDFVRFGCIGRLFGKLAGDAPMDYLRLFSSGEFAPVMSATVLREHDDGLQVLSGPRSETNGTHVDVVSVPTQRQVPILAAAAMKMCKVESRTPTEIMLRRHWYRYDSTEAMEIHRIGDLAAKVLAAKIGMADLVALRPDELYVSLESLTLGMSLVDADPVAAVKKIEAIAMLNAAVIVPPDTLAPDPPPAAYTALKWFDLESFQSGYQRRDAVGMFPEMASQAVGMCVHGVCMATTSRVLQRGLTLPKPDDATLVRYIPEGLDMAPYSYDVAP